ncbi:MAG: DMT family protein [Bacteroidales bacterium]|nr:DMT family protein [Bacteroidales bacterium]
MNKFILTIVFLLIANIFMTLAWYGHLKMSDSGLTKNWPLLAIIVISWGIAFIEYCFQVPANRIGFHGNGGPFSLMQLKIMQEVLSITVFLVFSLIAFKNESIRWNHIAAFICIIMAVYFVFKK